MNTNEHLDFYNPDSIYYANSHHYIQQLEAKVRQQQAEIGFYKQDADKYKLKCESQQAEIDRLKSLCISYIDEEWSGTSSYQNKIDEVNNDCKKINR